MSSLKPSSATAGFFQTPPTVPPQYAPQDPSHTLNDNDPALPRILALYLPAPPETNQPTLHPLDPFGAPNRTDILHTSDAWLRLQDIGIEEGMVAIGYESSSGVSAGAGSQ